MNIIIMNISAFNKDLPVLLKTGSSSSSHLINISINNAAVQATINIIDTTFIFCNTVLK